MEYFNQVTDKYLYILQRDTHHKYKIKLELLTENEITVGEITRDVDITNQGQININRQQITRRSCSLSLANVDNKYVPSPNNPFWIDRKFKLWVGLKDDVIAYSGGEPTMSEDVHWFSQGIFITKSANMDSHILSIEAVDKGGLLNGDLGTNGFNDNVIVQAGSNITDFVKDTLGISENGFMVDSTQPIIDTCFNDRYIQQNITINRNEYIGKLFEDVASSYNADIFYDVNGRLNLRPCLDYIYEGSQFDFVDTDSHYIQSTIQYDYDVINAVTVYSNISSVEGENVSYTAYNRNPQSPFNVGAIKTRYMDAQELKYANVDAAEMKKRCEDYANYLLLSNSLLKMTESFSTCIVPHLDVDHVVTITDRAKGLVAVRFVIQSITIPLSAGNMSIEATNINYLPLDKSIEKG